MPRILNPDAYRHVFEPWRGKRVELYYDQCGNVGDMMIRAAEMQLFRHFEITVDFKEKPDAVFFGGGGNMGGFYPSAVKALTSARISADIMDVPLVVLPQSWMGAESTRIDVAFAREAGSLLLADARLAPDLALALEVDAPATEPVRAEGWFFRADRERMDFNRRKGQGDPALLARIPSQYLALAALHEVVHTDRLHFAIAALLMGRRAVLYPNSYWKNRGVWELWLKGRGCEWRDFSIDSETNPSHSSR